MTNQQILKLLSSDLREDNIIGLIGCTKNLGVHHNWVQKMIFISQGMSWSQFVRLYNLGIDEIDPMKSNHIKLTS